MEPFPYPDPFPDPFNPDQRYRICVDAKRRECAMLFNAEVYTAAAITTGLLAACVAATLGTQYYVCVALALVAHAAQIAAAEERYKACKLRGETECRLQYGGQ
jgi:hypothetical protein